MSKKTPLAPKSVGSKGEITLHQLAAVGLGAILVSNSINSLSH